MLALEAMDKEPFDVVGAGRRHTDRVNLHSRRMRHAIHLQFDMPRRGTIDIRGGILFKQDISSTLALSPSTEVFLGYLRISEIWNDS